jgi:hypothetical protein
VKFRLMFGMILTAAAAVAQTVCAPSDLAGIYGMQLAGSSTISGAITPVTSVGRLVLDGSGKISGYSSVNFKGLFLGNPVTGTYAAKDDCTATFSLQDDSGAWQKFSGKMKPGGASMEFHQEDPQTAVAGTLTKTPASCGAAFFRGTYTFTMTALQNRVTAQADGVGNLSFTMAGRQTNGTYNVDSDCFVEMEFELPGAAGAVKARGIVIDEGAQIVGVRSDPAQVAAVRFRR